VRPRLLSILALLALATTGCFNRPAAAPGNTFAAATPSPSPSPTPSPTESPRDTDGDDTRANGRALDPGASAEGKQDTEQPSDSAALNDLIQDQVANCTRTGAARDANVAAKLGSTDYLVLIYDCGGIELNHELMPYESVGRAVNAFNQLRDIFVAGGSEAIDEQPLRNSDGQVYGRIVGLRNQEKQRDTLLWGNGRLLAAVSGPLGTSLTVFFRNVPY
jgi:hypothetical protein